MYVLGGNESTAMRVDGEGGLGGCVILGAYHGVMANGDEGKRKGEWRLGGRMGRKEIRV